MGMGREQPLAWVMQRQVVAEDWGQHCAEDKICGCAVFPEGSHANPSLGSITTAWKQEHRMCSEGSSCTAWQPVPIAHLPSGLLSFTELQ